MTRKIEITSGERTFIVAALTSYTQEGEGIELAGKFLADRINHRFQFADGAEDGPEVDILRRQV